MPQNSFIKHKYNTVTAKSDQIRNFEYIKV